MGLIATTQPLLQEQALHMVSADTNILVVTKTYALNRFREIIQNLDPPWDIHEVLLAVMQDLQRLLPLCHITMFILIRLGSNDRNGIFTSS